ncbi:hypothetical protein BDR26DRAFT_952851 [Obelidium mucronatum]|nr:hypothetical protein BDR26DRAFT_952851 [Obelidium mucronatum]
MGNTPSQPSQPTTALVFGNTGNGKSRVINLCRYGDEINSDLANEFPELAAYVVGPGSAAEDTANESDGVQGAAVSQQAFHRKLLNAVLLDSPGFQEGGLAATYRPKDAVIAVFNTIRQAEKGLNVLVYPIMACRNQRIDTAPVTLFYEIMCEKKVPLIIVVTMMDLKMLDATPQQLQQPALLYKWLTEPAVKGHTRTNEESIKFSLFGDDIPENVYVIPFCGKPGPSRVWCVKEAGCRIDKEMKRRNETQFILSVKQMSAPVLQPENQQRPVQHPPAGTLGMLAQTAVHIQNPSVVGTGGASTPQRHAPHAWGPLPRSPGISASHLPARPMEDELDLEDDVSSEVDWQHVMAGDSRAGVASQQTSQSQNFRPILTPRHSTRMPSQQTPMTHIGRVPPPVHRLPSGRVLGGVPSPVIRPAVRLPSGSILGGPPATSIRPEAEVELDGTTLIVKKKESDLDILRGFVPYVNQRAWSSPVLGVVPPSYSFRRNAVFARLQEYRDWSKLYPALLPHLHRATPYGAPVLSQLRPLTRALEFPLQLDLILKKSVAPCELFVETRYLDDVDGLYARVKDFPVNADAALRKYAVRHGKPVVLSSGQAWTTAMTRITDIEDAIFFDEYGSITTEDNKEYIHQGITLIEANSDRPFAEFCMWDLSWRNFASANNLPLAPFHREKEHFSHMFIPNWMQENDAPVLNLSRYMMPVPPDRVVNRKRSADEVVQYPQKRRISADSLTYGNRDQSFTSRKEREMAFLAMPQVLMNGRTAAICYNFNYRHLSCADAKCPRQHCCHYCYTKSNNRPPLSPVILCPVLPSIVPVSLVQPPVLASLSSVACTYIPAVPSCNHLYLLHNPGVIISPKWSRNLFQNPQILITYPSVLSTEKHPPLPQPPVDDLRYKRIMASLSRCKEFSVFTPIRVDRIRHIFQIHPNQLFVHSLCAALLNGMFAGDGDLDRPRTPRIRQKMPPSAADLTFIKEKIAEDIPLSRVVPIATGTIPDYCSSVALFVDRPTGKKPRLIHDFSHPANDSFNDHIPDAHATIHYDTIQNTIPLLRDAHRYCPPGFRVILWKTDVRGAFRLLPQHILLQSLQIISVTPEFFVDKCVSFGSRSGPYWWCALSHLINWYLVKILCLHSLVMMDDFWGVTYQHISAPLTSKPEDMLLAQEFITSLGIPLSTEKDVWGPCIPVVGYQVDATSMELSLTHKQLHELLAFLESWLICPVVCFRLNVWSKLTGYLNWAANIFLRLKPHFCPIYHQMRSKVKTDVFPVNTSTFTSLRWIQQHLLTASPVRYLDLETWTIGQAHLHVFADATLSGFAFWIPQRDALYYYLHPEPFCFPDRQPVIIHSVELYAHLVAVSFLARTESHLRFIQYTDNTGVFANMDSLHSSVPLNWSILQALNDLEIQHHFSTRPQWLSTHDNIMADLGSRGEIEKLHLRSPSTSVSLLTISDLPTLSDHPLVFRLLPSSLP